MTKTLSSAQKPIFEMIEKGMTPFEIAKAIYPKLSVQKARGLVNAQLTRMKSAGVRFTYNIPSTDSEEVLISEKPKPRKSTRPTSDGLSRTDKTAQELRSFGPAEYNIKEAIEKALKARNPDNQNNSNIELLKQKIKESNLDDNQASNVGNVDLMMLLGCTIQYVKLCGGRFAAHQTIEDVFQSLKVFCD